MKPILSLTEHSPYQLLHMITNCGQSVKMRYLILFTGSYLLLLGGLACVHRRLQSCVGTLARVGYTAFDVQLQKVYFVITLYAFCTSHTCYVLVTCVFASGPHDMSTHDLK